MQRNDSTLGNVLRGLEVFFPFINLCILVTQAAFQSRWKVGISARVVVSLLVCLLGLVHSGLVLACFILADNWRFLRGLERFFKQIRVSVILDSTQFILNLLMAAIATASASSAGCKDPSKDPHADIEGYTDALPTFCRNKRASAAFFWLALVACSGTFTLCLMTVVRIRRTAQTSAFASPASAPEVGAHFPRDADDDSWGGRASYDAAAPVAATAPAGYRPSHDYSSGGPLFAGQAPGYGHGVRDPFEDPELSDREEQTRAAHHAIADPYEAIRQSMERPSPQRY
ncbi:hypothetical protein JCM3774_004357 [Rhodotorula dairenensis]